MTRRRIFIGTALAWVTTRTDVPLRRVWALTRVSPARSLETEGVLEIRRREAERFTESR